MFSMHLLGEVLIFKNTEVQLFNYFLVDLIYSCVHVMKLIINDSVIYIYIYIAARRLH